MLDRRDRPEARRQIDARRAARDQQIFHGLISPHVGAAETIDGLLGIAHDEELARRGHDVLPAADRRVRRRQQEHDLRLQRVGVLELVDEDVREAALEIGAHLATVAHEIARSQQEVDEVERGGARLELFVAVHRFEHLLMDQGRQISVGLAGKGFERCHELCVSRQDLVSREAAAVIALSSLARALEVALAEQIDQRRLDRVVVAGCGSLACADVFAEPPEWPEIGVESVGRRRAGGNARVQAMHPGDQRVDRRVAVERAPLPRRPEVAPAGHLPARAPKPVDRIAVERAPAERAPQAFGRSLELLGQPGVEGAAVERLGLGLGQHLEARIRSRFDGPLVEEIVAEAVDRANARLFQVRDRVLEPRAPRASFGRALALLLEPGAQPELQLAGRLLGERERRDRLDGSPPLGEHVDEACHQLARLARAGCGLDHERLVERGPDTLALDLVDQGCHGHSLSVRSSSSRAGSFCLIRASS
jgi:hypothetical protein